MRWLMIISDLGRMKAFRIVRDEDDPSASPAFEDLADLDLENLHSRVGDRVTDQAGRFPSGLNGMAIGERHGEEEEARHKQMEAMARQINEVAAREQGSICLAAPRVMCRQLLAALRPEVRRRVRKSLPLNLVKAPKLELLKRFGLS